MFWGFLPVMVYPYFYLYKNYLAVLCFSENAAQGGSALGYGGVNRGRIVEAAGQKRLMQFVLLPLYMMPVCTPADARAKRSQTSVRVEAVREAAYKDVRAVSSRLATRSHLRRAVKGKNPATDVIAGFHWCRRDESNTRPSHYEVS